MPPAYLTNHVWSGFQNNRGKLGRGHQERLSSMLVRALQTAVIRTMHTRCGGNNSVLLPLPTSICIPLSFLSVLAIKTNKMQLKGPVLFSLIVFWELVLLHLRSFTHRCPFSLLSCVTQSLLFSFSSPISRGDSRTPAHSEKYPNILSHYPLTSFGFGWTILCLLNTFTSEVLFSVRIVSKWLYG